jgi:hypothetical protein
MPGAIDEGVVSADVSRDFVRRQDAEIAGVKRDLGSRFDGQPGRSAHDDAHFVPGGERLMKHVLSEGPGRAEDDQTRHCGPRSW